MEDSPSYMSPVMRSISASKVYQFGFNWIKMSFTSWLMELMMDLSRCNAANVSDREGQSIEVIVVEGMVVLWVVVGIGWSELTNGISCVDNQ